MANGEIALCILSAINVGTIDKRDELEQLCDLAVRSLDEIIDHQNYPVLRQRNINRSKKKFRHRLYWSCSLSC